MNKISFSANPDANYVFHMMSVAGCGYENAYGEKYRKRYDPAEIKILKDHERHLTVKGGEYWGDWYGPMVFAPACGDIPAKDYYNETLKMAEDGRLNLPKEEKKAVIRTCEVLVKHYDDYIDNIWPVEKERIERYIVPLRKAFEENDFTDKAEDVSGIILPPPGFTASLVTSIAGGAEALDISPTQDIFGIERSIDAEVTFISHEYIIYLLKIALKDELVIDSKETWILTEGLAEYYLQKIDCHARSFQECQEQAEAYRRLSVKHGDNAKDLYRAALGELMSGSKEGR